MSKYLKAARSQIPLYKKTPLFKRNQDGKFLLYKAENITIDANRLSEDKLPQLYIKKDHRIFALREIKRQFRKKLKKNIKSGDITSVKRMLCSLLEEATSSESEDAFDQLPKTISILYDGYIGNPDILKKFYGISLGPYSLTEHSVNVMTLTFNFCLLNKFDEFETLKLSMSAMLHDVGLTKLPADIIRIDKSMSNKKFQIYKTHPVVGHDLIRRSNIFDPEICSGILEHHERLNGSGFPNGTTNLSLAGRLISLIDSFESLTGSANKKRKSYKSFDALMLIKNETRNKGKFDKNIYRDFCLSLGHDRHISS